MNRCNPSSWFCQWRWGMAAASLLCSAALSPGWSQESLNPWESAESAPANVLHFDVNDAESAGAEPTCTGGACLLPAPGTTEPAGGSNDCLESAFDDATPVADPLCQSLAPPSLAAVSTRSWNWKRWTRDPATTGIFSVALVVAGYFVLRFLLAAQRGSSRGRAAGQVIEIVAQVPLGPRHHLQLVRLATRLVLISVNPQGAETLAEITDPLEVDQIMEACQTGGPTLAGALDRLSRRASERGRLRSGSGRIAPRAVFEA